ncbi:SIMPL domain-containing protein [Leeia sp. TBRC 13508]|uniref:SIMPL domain-containing protein n=1 Tax=Leeia speluncae TaxID=2884804 RepID=A0ABS8D7M1_9NEIS|nr:SIMPL domain-containing protein [Leeia speluncae]MCB6184185.1 SIMPL domain-containing protein [Leeia speluncae]
MLKSFSLAASFLLLCNNSAYAEALNYDVVQLQAGAKAQIQNDTISANLFNELNDADPQRLNRMLDKQFDEAVLLSKQYPSVKLQLSLRQTYPVYGQNNKLQSWRGRLELNVSAQDITAASVLIGKLQSQFVINGVGYSVSEAKRSSVEQMVTKEALKSFQDKAGVVTSTLAPGKQYKLVNLQVSTEMPRPLMAVKALSKEMAAPLYDQANAGESDLSVQVFGSIQIQP